MKCYPQSVHDQLTGNDIWFGIDLKEGCGPAYDKAMEYINAHQEWRGGERIEYSGNEQEIKFMWDMIEGEFKALMAPLDDNGSEEPDYLGAVFFGNFKLEFIHTQSCGGYRNLFQYGANDGGEYSPYAYLEDGTPYEERYPESNDIKIHKRRVFENFANDIERQIVDLLNAHPEFIEDALKPTEPTKWYPDGQCNVTRDITRIA